MRKLLVLFAVLALLAIPAVPAAATDGAPVVVTGGYAAAVMTITSPTVPGFGIFKAGENKIASSPDGSVTVVKNSQEPTGWTVTAKDVTQGGYMRIGGTTNLASKLYVSADNVSYFVADTGCTWTGSAFPGTLPLYLSQTVANTDTVGTYGITLTVSGNLTF